MGIVLLERQVWFLYSAIYGALPPQFQVGKEKQEL
jgi:hypothetical protein